MREGGGRWGREEEDGGGRRKMGEGRREMGEGRRKMGGGRWGGGRYSDILISLASMSYSIKKSYTAIINNALGRR